MQIDKLSDVDDKQVIRVAESALELLIQLISHRLTFLGRRQGKFCCYLFVFCLLSSFRK
jgi:hypothetical protein